MISIKTNDFHLYEVRYTEEGDERVIYLGAIVKIQDVWYYKHLIRNWYLTSEQLVDILQQVTKLNQEN